MPKRQRRPFCLACPHELRIKMRVVLEDPLGRLLSVLPGQARRRVVLARYVQNWARGAYEDFEGEENVDLDAESAGSCKGSAGASFLTEQPGRDLWTVRWITRQHGVRGHVDQELFYRSPLEGAGCRVARRLKKV
jgi:hypothetical protein